MKSNKKYIILFFCLLFLILLICHFNKKPPLNDNWPDSYSITSSSQLNENLLTIKNVRNFRYGEKENVLNVNYYDKTYNLDDLIRVWYIYEPFGYAAHSFLSFEFKNDIFLTISIEAKTNNHQTYNASAGIFRSYPLIYVVADENDSILMRTNVRRNRVILYPMTMSSEDGKNLLLEMMREVNDLNVNPKWYNTINANCTNLIAYHINKINPGKIPSSWKLILAGFADEVFYDKNLLDTNLPFKEAKSYYDITEKSREIGDVYNYSKLIREKFNY